MWSGCLNVLGLGSGKGKEEGLLGDPQPSRETAKCVFCNPTPEKGFDIVLEEERFIAFRDRDPAAAHHLLAIPREHITNVKSLRGEPGAQLVEELHRFGTRALAKVMHPIDVARSHDNDALGKDLSPASSPETRYGFHVSDSTQIPPFRSVEHLHLHCLALPFRSPYRALKYRVAPGDPKARPSQHKGWSWFVTAVQTIAILRDGGTVKVGAC